MYVHFVLINYLKAAFSLCVESSTWCTDWTFTCTVRFCTHWILQTFILLCTNLRRTLDECTICFEQRHAFYRRHPKKKMCWIEEKRKGFILSLSFIPKRKECHHTAILLLLIINSHTVLVLGRIIIFIIKTLFFCNDLFELFRHNFRYRFVYCM